MATPQGGNVNGIQTVANPSAAPIAMSGGGVDLGGHATPQQVAETVESLSKPAPLATTSPHQAVGGHNPDGGTALPGAIPPAAPGVVKAFDEGVAPVSSAPVIPAAPIEPVGTGAPKPPTLAEQQKMIQDHNQQVADSFVTSNQDVAHMGTTQLRGAIEKHLQGQGVDTSSTSKDYEGVVGRVNDIQSKIRSKVPQFTEDQYYQSLLQGNTFTNAPGNSQLNAALNRVARVQKYTTMTAGDLSGSIALGNIFVGGQAWQDLQGQGQGPKLQQAVSLVNAALANKVSNTLIGAIKVDPNQSLASQSGKNKIPVPDYSTTAEANVVAGMPDNAIDAFKQFVTNNPLIQTQQQNVAKIQDQLFKMQDSINNAENDVRAQVLTGGATEGLVLAIAGENARSLTPQLQSLTREYSVQAGLYEKQLDIAKGQFEAYNQDRQYKLQQQQLNISANDISYQKDALGNTIRVITNKLTGETTTTPVGITVDENGNISNAGGGNGNGGGDTPAVRNNNPGNIKDKGTNGNDANGFAIYNTPEEGFQALVNKLNNAKDGKSTVYPSTMTIGQFFQKYAPSSDNNNPGAYAQDVAKNLGVSVNTPISQLDTTAWAKQISKHEDINMYNKLFGGGGNSSNSSNSSSTSESPAQKVANYEIPYTSVLGNENVQKAVLAQAMKINPNFNPASYDTVQKVVNDAAPAASNAVKLLDHFDQYIALVKAANGNNLPEVSRIMNNLGYKFGGTAQSALQVAQQNLGTEYASAYGENTGDAQKARQSLIDASSNEAQATKVAQTAASFLAGLLGAQNNTYKTFTNKDIPVLANNKDLLDRFAKYGVSFLGNKPSVQIDRSQSIINAAGGNNGNQVNNSYLNYLH